MSPSRRLSVLVLVALLVTALVVPLASAAAPSSRLSGPDRFSTAAEVSRHAFPEGSSVAYLARAEDPIVDALVAGSLTDGPVLLVPSCGPVPGVVSAELDRLAANEVLAIGGPAAICDQVLTDAAAGRSSGRVQGPDRYATAVAVSQRAFPGGSDVVYLARAEEPLVDALPAGALSDGPILLVPGCGDVPAVVAAEIDRLDPSRVIALGGQAAICQDTLVEAADGRATARLAGSDRFATSVAISSHGFPGGSDIVYLARGVAPLVDALAGGALTGGPILLVPECGPVPQVILDEIARLAPTSVLALGGEVAVCDAVLTEAADAAPDPEPEPSPSPTPSPTTPPSGGGGGGTPPPPPPPPVVTQKDALVALYNATDGPNWTDDTGWLVADDECTWFGITCVDGEVTEIVLEENGLNGPIPADISVLTSLEVLAFYKNQVTALPSEIGSLTALHTLDIWENAVPSLPAEIVDLPQIVNLYLGYNQIGNLPDGIGSLATLEALYLNDNLLTGDITAFATNLASRPAPPAEFKLADWGPPGGGNDCLVVTDTAAADHLTALDEWWEICSTEERAALEAIYDATGGTSWTESTGWKDPLVHHCDWARVNCHDGAVTALWLEVNGLAGPIPPAISDLPYLTDLDAWDNAITSLPDSLGDLRQLTHVKVADNDIPSLPASIGQLDRLEVLDLKGNAISSVPPELANLDSLLELYLTDNALVGQNLSPFISGLKDTLTAFSVSDGADGFDAGNDCLTADAADRPFLDDRDPAWHECTI